MRRPRNFVAPTRKELYKLYVIEKMTYFDLMKKYHIGTIYLKKLLVGYKIPIKRGRPKEIDNV